MIGTTVGPYRILSLLGRGAMGEVYLAEDERLRRKIALKVLPLAFAEDHERRGHFEREARALGALNHPGIVGVHAIEEHGGQLLLAMEFVDGTPLSALIPAGGMAFDEIVRIGSGLAEALSVAHRHGIVHRDVKPANVMVKADGAIKVLDFGLAKVRRSADTIVGVSADGSSSATIPGTIIGTAHYMSPEQAQGLPVDARSDIFSLGIVLFHMATGRRPFEGDTPVAVLSSIVKDTPPPVTDTRPELPASFARVVARCLEKDPACRVQDAADLAQALRETATDVPGTAVGSRAARSSAPELVSKRRRWIAGVVAALFCTVLGTTAAWWFVRSRVTPPIFDDSRVAVAPFENRTGDAAMDAVGLMAADRLARGLVEQLSLQVVPATAVIEAWPPPRRGDADSPSPDRITVLARRLGAGVVVSGDYYDIEGELAFRGRITDVHAGREIAQLGPLRAPRNAPGLAVERLREYVTGEAAIHFKGGGGAATAGVPAGFAPTSPPMTYETYREFLAGLDAFGREPQAAVAHLQRVEELYPYRALVLPWLTLTYMRLEDYDRAEQYTAVVRKRAAPEDIPLVDYFSARLDGRWLDAYAAIRTFHRSMPMHLPTVNTVCGAAIALGRPHEAAALLRSVEVEPWLDSSSGRAWLSNSADVAHMLGRYDQERQVATMLAGVSPAAAGPLVRSLAALGRGAELGEVIERAQLPAPPGAFSPTASLFKLAAEESRLHGHTGVSRDTADRGLKRVNAVEPRMLRGPLRQLKGELLLLSDRPRDSAAEFARAVDERPDDVAALAGLGVSLARQGQLAAAERLIPKLSGLNGRHRYGAHTFAQARIAAAVGQRERAVLLLQQAFAEGYIIAWRAHADPAFEKLRGDPSFDRLTALDQDAVERR